MYRKSLEEILNSRSNAWKPVYLCTRKMPCRCILECKRCYQLRRSYFVNECSSRGEVFGLTNNFCSHLVVAFKTKGAACPWEVLLSVRPLIARIFTGKAGKYIACWSIDQKQDLAHLHLIVVDERVAVLSRLLQKVGSMEWDIFITRVTSLDGLLGYIFDRNFIPTFSDERRPRRYRCLTASRGLPCGFPPLEINVVAGSSE